MIWSHEIGVSLVQIPILGHEKKKVKVNMVFYDLGFIRVDFCYWLTFFVNQVMALSNLI